MVYMRRALWQQSVVMCTTYLPDSYSITNHSRLKGALHLLKAGTLSKDHPAQLQNRQEQSARCFGASSFGKTCIDFC